MAQFVSTFDTYDSNRKKEEFADEIYNITPEETPFLSMLDRTSVKSKHPEWMTDTLQPPQQNAYIEADMYSFEMPVEPLRVGNYTQNSRKAWQISRIQERVDKAGPGSDLGRYRRIKGVEIRQDMELALMQNVGSTAGNSNTPSLTAGMLAWLTTNVSRGAGGSSGGFQVGTGFVTPAVNGTKRAFTKDIMDDVGSRVYSAGGKAKTWMVPPWVKRTFSTFMSNANVATQRYVTPSSGPTKIVAAADMYEGDFGEYTVVPNRLMMNTPELARNALLVDPNMVDVGILRDVTEDKPDIPADVEARVLLVDYCLYMKNEAAHGVAADLFGISATV